MPLNIEFVNKLIGDTESHIESEYRSLISIIKSETLNILHFKKLILGRLQDIYLTDFVKALLDTDDKVRMDTKLVESTLSRIKDLNNTTTQIVIAQNKDVDKVIRLYIISFCTSFLARVKAREQYLIYKQLYKLNKVRLAFILRKYFFNVQRSLLRGHHYNIPIVNFTLSIIGKPVRHKYNKAHKVKLKPDWGASYRYLKELAEKHDSKLLALLNSKRITKQEFIVGMRKYNLKWYIYHTNTINFWVRLQNTYCPDSNGRYYNIVPNNFIGNATKSQIDFTNKHNQPKDIIDYPKMGFRDKLKALERVALDYCKTTFRHDLQPN